MSALVPELPPDEAHRGYAVGTAVMDAVLPPHAGPTAIVPVALDAKGLELRDGIYAKEAIVSQPAQPSVRSPSMMPNAS
jgi:arginase